MISVMIVEDDLLIAEAHRTYLSRLEGFSAVAVVHTATAEKPSRRDRYVRCASAMRRSSSTIMTEITSRAQERAP